MELLAIVIPSTEYSATVQYRVAGQGPVRRTVLTVRSDDREQAVRTLGIMADLHYGIHYVITDFKRWDIDGNAHPVWDDGDDV